MQDLECSSNRGTWREEPRGTHRSAYVCRSGGERVTPLLEARGIVKRFGHVTALGGADFAIGAGEVTALIGDNGAGKSTLVKVLSGVYAPDEGELLLKGEPVKLDSPQHARQLGLETVFQDLALAPE